MRHPVKNTFFSYLSQVPRHIKVSCYVILWDSQDKILAYCWFEPYIFIYYLTLLNCWHYVSNIENYERKKSKFVKNLWLEIAKLSSNSNFNSVCSWDSLILSPTGGVGVISAVLRLRKNADFFWLFTLHALIYLMKILSLKYGSFDDFQPPLPYRSHRIR